MTTAKQLHCKQLFSAGCLFKEKLNRGDQRGGMHVRPNGISEIRKRAVPEIAFKVGPTVPSDTFQQIDTKLQFKEMII